MGLSILKSFGSFGTLESRIPSSWDAKMLNANAAQSLLQTRGFFTCAKALQGDCPSGKSQGAYYTHGQLVNISAKL